MFLKNIWGLRHARLHGCTVARALLGLTRATIHWRVHAQLLGRAGEFRVKAPALQALHKEADKLAVCVCVCVCARTHAYGAHHSAVHTPSCWPIWKHRAPGKGRGRLISAQNLARRILFAWRCIRCRSGSDRRSGATCPATRINALMTSPMRSACHATISHHSIPKLSFWACHGCTSTVCVYACSISVPCQHAHTITRHKGCGTDYNTRHSWQALDAPCPW